MIKREIIGKRYSRRTRVTAKGDAEIAELFQQIAKAAGDKKTISFGRWQERAAQVTKQAADYLESKELPSAPKLFKWGNTVEWSAKPPAQIDTADPFEYRSIASHIKKLGYDDDSAEGIAARIIAKAGLLETHRQGQSIDSAISEAIEFGVLITLWRVYSLESKINKSNASVDRSKKWAGRLATELRSDYDRFDDAWDSISEDGDQVYREDGRVNYCGRDEQASSLSRESFRTGYWLKATNK